MSDEYEVLGYFETDLRVRFGETDRFGYMWHGWVLAYFERARAQIAREHDLTPSHLLEFDLTVPMVDLDIAYKHVAYDDEELIVQATLLRRKLRMPILDFHYRVVKKDGGTEVAHGRTRQVLMKTTGRISTRIPAEISSRMDGVYAYLETCPRWDDSTVEAILSGL